MTSVVCARLGAVRVSGATSSPRCAQKLDMPTCTTFAGPELHKTWAKRNLGGYRQPNVQALALSLSRTSFLGAGSHRLLSPLTCKGRTGSAKFQVVAIKRGGGPRRRTREANPMEQASKGPKMNEAVLAYPNIRLLDQDQKMIGIVASSDALLAARNKELDLVLIAGDADPPVCRIMDYTKYKYEKDKKARDTLKRSKANRVDQKELKMRYNTDVGDYNTTLRKCMRFLRAGDKVKFSMNFKAREMGFQKQGITLFEKVQADIGEWGVTEGRITVEGRNILLMVGPNKPYIERMRREEAKAGKVVEEDSSDDEEEEQESEEVDSDDDEEDDVSGEDNVSGEDDVPGEDDVRGEVNVRGEEVASNGAALESQSTPAAVQ